MDKNTGGHGFDPWSGKIPHAREQLSYNFWAHVLFPESCNTQVPRPHALQQEKPPQWAAHTLQLESSLPSPQLEKAHTQ